MADSEDFARVVSNRVRPTLQMLLALGAATSWLAKNTWDFMGQLRDAQEVNEQQDEDLAKCMAADTVHMEQLAASEKRHALALQAIFEHNDLAMEMAMEKLSAQRKIHYCPGIKAQSKTALKLIYSIPVPKEVGR